MQVYNYDATNSVECVLCKNRFETAEIPLHSSVCISRQFCGAQSAISGPEGILNLTSVAETMRVYDDYNNLQRQLDGMVKTQSGVQRNYVYTTPSQMPPSPPQNLPQIRAPIVYSPPYPQMPLYHYHMQSQPPVQFVPTYQPVYYPHPPPPQHHVAMQQLPPQPQQQQYEIVIEKKKSSSNRETRSVDKGKEKEVVKIHHSSKSERKHVRNRDNNKTSDDAGPASPSNRTRRTYYAKKEEQPVHTNTVATEGTLVDTEIAYEESLSFSRRLGGNRKNGAFNTAVTPTYSSPGGSNRARLRQKFQPGHISHDTRLPGHDEKVLWYYKTNGHYVPFATLDAEILETIYQGGKTNARLERGRVVNVRQRLMRNAEGRTTKVKRHMVSLHA